MADPGRSVGYTVPILRGCWERITSFGVPRAYHRAWVCLCLFAGLYLLTYWGWRWLMLPGAAWLLGQAALVLLTRWNPHWDDILMAQLNRRYRPRYRAG